MNFDTTICITDIISVVAIFLTLITIWQVKLQRSDALKPYITITPYDKVYRYTNGKMDFDENVEVLLSNIGSSLSKNIAIEMRLCDIPRDLLSEDIQISKNICKINKQKLLILQQSIELTYCESKEQKSIGNYLRNYIMILCQIYIDICSSNMFNKYRNTAKIAIKISYHNILGKKYNKHIILQLDPLSLSANAIQFYIKTNELTKRQYLKIISR